LKKIILKKTDIYITGIGTVNSIGLSADESLASLLAEKRGTEWSPKHKLTLGSVSLSNDELSLMFSQGRSNLSRTTLLGLAAASEAWGSNREIQTVRTGIISSTSAGQLDITESRYASYLNGNPNPSDAQFTEEAGETTEQLSEHLGISGYVNTLSTACSSGANAILLGARLIQSGRLDRVLVGGVDPFCDHNIKGFSSLNICDKEACKPFDKNRNGLNLAEGAAFIVLENEMSLSKTQNTPICIVSGWSNTADAFHQTASSPDGEGASLAMKRALTRANLVPADISYVNAHGTGTYNNDSSEYSALQAIFGTEIPPYSSTKSFTGHALAAAGAIEAVFCVLAIQNGFMPANLNFKTQTEGVEFGPLTSNTSSDLKNVLSNSFGFGGNCTSLIFSAL
jgi:3-oxoacyl-[acyl-carrier-protein] synthase I